MDCEIVIIDGGSTDHTELVIREYLLRFSNIRYIRQCNNGGIDGDYDRAVEAATGEYCWLMTDDDTLRPDAITHVLSSLREDISLLIINTEFMDITMSRIIDPRWLELDTDRMYDPEQMDALAIASASILTFIGCIVIKREIWIQRDRQRYYGSLFIHLGVVFQHPLPGNSLIISKPLISYRMGNSHTFSSKFFEVSMFRFPSLVWSLPLSDVAKRTICKAEPWKNVPKLLWFSAIGSYSLREYRQLILPRVGAPHEAVIPAIVAMFPRVIVNFLFVAYYCLVRFCCRRRQQRAELMLEYLRESPFHVRNW